MAEESGLKTKIIRAFGLEDLNDEYDYEDEEYYSEEEIAQLQSRAEPSSVQTPTQSTPSPREDTLPDVIVLEPTTFEEAPGIVNKLKRERTIVVNLKQTEFEEGRKIFDFLSGAVFALEGSLNRIAESVFILAPRLVSVATQVDEPRITEETSSSEILTWEDN